MVAVGRLTTMPNKKSTKPLQSIDPTQLGTVTGGAGSGPGPAQRYRQPMQAQHQEPQWLQQLEQWAQSVTGNPWSKPATPSGQAGTAGTPGAWVHNGRFRPL